MRFITRRVLSNTDSSVMDKIIITSLFKSKLTRYNYKNEKLTMETITANFSFTGHHCGLRAENES